MNFLFISIFSNYREGFDEKYLCDADPLTLGIAVQPDSEKDCDIFWCQKYITNNLRSAQALWNRCCGSSLRSVFSELVSVCERCELE